MEATGPGGWTGLMLTLMPRLISSGQQAEEDKQEVCECAGTAVMMMKVKLMMMMMMMSQQQQQQPEIRGSNMINCVTNCLIKLYKRLK